MDVASLFVDFYSFTDGVYQVHLVRDTNDVKAWTGTVATVDAHGLQAEEYLEEGTLLAIVHHTVQFDEVLGCREDAEFVF